MSNNDSFLSLNGQLNAQKILWVQGPGGNTSTKRGDQLLIKASGTRIRELNALAQLAVLQITQLRQDLLEMDNAADAEAAYKAAIERNTLPQSPRPSMESGFHAWLPQQNVFHFHSLAAVGLAAFATKTSKFWPWYKTHWESRLGDLEVIAPCLPGMELTQRIIQSPEASIYWLKNHGVILQFEDAEFLELYRRFEHEALAAFQPEAWSHYSQWLGLEASELVERHPELLTATLKFYFPDMAILYPRMAKHLEPLPSNEHRFIVEKATLDLDALENWLAHSILQNMFPELEPLPETIAKAIPNLPTEIERKKVMEKKP